MGFRGHRATAPGIYKVKARAGGALGCAGLRRRRCKSGTAVEAGLENLTRTISIARNTARTIGRGAGVPTILLMVCGPMALWTTAQALPS